MLYPVQRPPRAFRESPPLIWDGSGPLARANRSRSGFRADDPQGIAAEGGSLSFHHQPTVVRLNLLDTDYAKIVAGEPIPDAKKQRLAQESYDFDKLGRHIARYRHGGLDQQSLDDILCTIATTAGLFTLADVEDINDRLRYTGCFYLTSGERQQVINWLLDELGIDLCSHPDPD